MANNAKDIENNMVSRKECPAVARTLYLPMQMYWVMIGKHFQLCATRCFRVILTSVYDIGQRGDA